MLATLAALVLTPALAAADCSEKKVDVTVRGGALQMAEFTGGGGPLGPRKLVRGEEVTGDRLPAGQTYYAPKGVTATVTIGGYDFAVRPRTVFLPQCELFGPGLYFRLLEGKVEVSGPRFSGNRSKGYAVTPEATFKPLPGRPDYTLTRRVTDSMKTTRSRARAARDGSGLFVTLSSVSGKKVPCQAGKALTIFANGAYRNG